MAAALGIEHTRSVHSPVFFCSIKLCFDVAPLGTLSRGHTLGLPSRLAYPGACLQCFVLHWVHGYQCKYFSERFIYRRGSQSSTGARRVRCVEANHVLR